MTGSPSGTIGDRDGMGGGGDAPGPGPDPLPPPAEAPRIDDFGVLRYGDGWISLSRTQEAVVRPLVARFGEAVGRDEVAASIWPDGGPDRHNIDVHIHRLRPRLKKLGLIIHTLRGRGFMLENAAGQAVAGRR